VAKKNSDDVVTIMQYATIKRETFTIFSTELGVSVATRIQFPLSLAYAVTIHKAQGMTLDAVQVCWYMVNVRHVHARCS
jgi:ATP-dependent exoDNAse (exonuclease V) alpha subunit